MKIISNLPMFVKFISYLKYLNKYKKDIYNARVNGNKNEEREYILKATSSWGKAVVENLNIDLKVYGKENLPTDTDIPVVYMPNHQGYADVIIMCAALDTVQFGFIAKSGLEKVPFYGDWIDRIRSLTLDRNNAREGLKTINKAIALLKEKYSMLVFPEGTRSRGENMGEFKAGAMKLATKSGAKIIPVTLDGTWKLFEETGNFKPATIKVKIHPAIPTENISREDEKLLHKKVQSIVENGLKELQNT